MFALLLCCWSAWAAQPVAVEHTGTLAGATVRWDTRVLLDGPAARDEALVLALPLPPEARMQAPGAAERDAQGRAVALSLPAGATELRLVVDEPLDPGALRLPLFVGAAVNRIDLDGLHYEPAPALGLEQRLRHLVPAGMSTHERHQVDRLLDGRREPKGARIYVVADPAVLSAGGLVGEVGPAGTVPLGLALGVGGLFVVLLGGGAVSYRLLEVRARREQLLRYMQDEFVQADVQGRPRPVAPAAEGGPG